MDLEELSLLASNLKGFKTKKIIDGNKIIVTDNRSFHHI